MFAVIGSFLVQAAAYYDLGRARGLSGALGALWVRGHGAWPLAVPAPGLAAYRAYMLLAGHRRIDPA